MALKDIDTFVIVMMENRSFDHMCGYLSLPDAGHMPVDGLSNDPTWRAKFANDDRDGTPKEPYPLEPAIQNIADPPHEDVNIAVQIDTPTHDNASPILGGFVKSYWNATPAPPHPSLVMGHYDKRAVPVYDFFARNFAICDHWFSSLPAGTQPNRLMAMSGESHIHQNVSDPLDFPEQRLVYDWMTAVRGANSWCSYQWDGLPFFSLMHRWWGRIIAGLNDPTNLGVFRRYDAFKQQWQDGNAIPDVVFIEPKYTDDPTPSFRPRNDDHCPTGITEGQRFLADIYNTIISNPRLWASTMMIVTYDEHGGFFDHVTPPAVPAQAGEAHYKTTGVRVPAFIISPYVKPGTVFSDVVDNTSILRLLADRFTPRKPYSPAVEARQQHFKPLSRILDNPAVKTKPKPIPQSALSKLITGAPAARLASGEPSATAKAFSQASGRISRIHPDQVGPFDTSFA